MFSKTFSFASSLLRYTTAFGKCYSLVVCKRNLTINIFISRFGLPASGTRPFSLSSRVFPRVQNAEYLPVSKQDYSVGEMLTIKKRLKSKRKKDKLKTKLNERLEADRLEDKITATVEMVRNKLKLDESNIVKINMNIDCLIAEGIPIETISRIAVRSPKTLNQDLNVIKKRIRVFKINSLYEDSIRKCLKRNPSLLLCKLEDSLSQKVEAMRGLQLGLSVSEIAQILERCPDIIEYLTLEKLINKTELLKKIGFTAKQIRRIFIKNPAALTVGKDSLKERTEFCISRFNLTHDQVSKYPRVLQCPMKRLEERYLFLKQEQLSGEDIKIRGWAFKILAVNSDEYFVEKVAQKPLKKFRDFQEQRKREIKEI